MNLKKLLLLCFLVFTTMAFAQQSVKGSVKDSTGKPVAGATVQVVGASRSATTNSEGAYAIQAQAEETLRFSAQGYQNVEIKVGLSSVVDAVLLPMENKQEAGALGIERNKDAVGYNTQSTDAGQNLSGSVAGAQTSSSSSMGGNTNIILRGVGTVTGSNQPLIVIDGVPMATVGDGKNTGDALSDINPEDIESQSVLSGGAATALYGSRGGNGVILITTKSGKAGKTSIEVKSGVTFETAYIAPVLQNEYGGGDSQEFERANINGRVYNLARYAVDQSWGPKYKGQPYLPWYAFDQKYLHDEYLKEVPWQAPKKGIEKFYRTGVGVSNSFSVARSLSGTNLRFSLGNNQVNGIVPNTDLHKTNLAFSFSAKLSEKLKSEGGFNYVITARTNPDYAKTHENDLANVFYAWSHRQLDVEKMEKYYIDPAGGQRTWNRTSWSEPEPKFANNPYWAVYKNYNNDKRHRFFGNLGLTYNFRHNLYLVGKIYGDIYTFTKETRNAVGAYGVPSYQKTVYNNSDFNYETRLHYTPELGENFSLTGFIGMSRRESHYGWSDGKTVGGLVVPNFYNLANSKQTPRASDYSSWQRTNSVYGMASFGFKSMAFVEVTGRQDWFSTVSKPVFYPSVTGSFVFTSAWKNKPSWLSYGKVRVAWAQAGNDTGPYRLVNYPAVNPPFRNSPDYTRANTANNPDLVPEVKETKEAGLELRLFKDRVSINASVYNILSKDLIIPLPIDAANGYNWKYVNSGEMSNKGVEVTLSLTPIQTEKFNWNLNWNFSKNKNKLEKLAPGIKTYRVNWDKYGQVSLYAIEGRPFGELYGRDFVYDDKGNKVVGPNGKYLTSELKSLGNIIPDYTMGLTNSFRYGRLNFAFTFDFQKGGNYFSAAHMTGMSTGMLRETAANGIRELVRRNGRTEARGLILDGVAGRYDRSGKLVTEGKPNTKIIDPQTYGEGFFQGAVDKQNIFDATYLKLRSVTLSYDVPLPNTRYIKGMNISLFGNELWTTGLDWDGMDPETAASNQGLGEISLPTTRSFGMSVGLKL